VAVIALLVTCALVATVASASGSSTGTCATYSGETLLDIPGGLRVFAVTARSGQTGRTRVSVYACGPGRIARTRLIVEPGGGNGAYTCGPALIDSSRSWLAVACGRAGGPLSQVRVYEFPLGSTVGHRSATIVGGGLVGVMTSGGLALIAGCDGQVEVADATGVHVVAPASVTDLAVGGARVYWWTGRAIGAATATGHPKGSLAASGRCS
jgi:hypothetical protein